MESELRAELEACRTLCVTYQSDSRQHAERCRALEEAHAQAANDISQLRSQLAITSQLAKDQATQIISLERHLMQSSELAKTSNQRQATLEQQLRDSRMTSEKHALTTQGQLRSCAKQLDEQTARAQALEAENFALKDEVNALKAEKERLSSMSKQERDETEEIQQQLDLQRVENDVVSIEGKCTMSIRTVFLFFFEGETRVRGSSS